MLGEGHTRALQITITRAHISVSLTHIHLTTWQKTLPPTQSSFVLVTLRILFLEKKKGILEGSAKEDFQRYYLKAWECFPDFLLRQ